MPAEPKVIEALATNLAFVKSFDPDSLKSDGPFNFSAGVEDARAYIQLFSPLRVEVFDRCPNNVTVTVANQLEDCASLVRRARDFNPERSQNANSERVEILAGLRSGRERALNGPTELITAIVLSLDVNAMTADARRLTTQLETSSAKAKSVVDEVLAGLAQARIELGKITLSNEAKRFSTEADSHAAIAARWLKASVGAAVLTGIFALTAHKVFAWLGLTIENATELQILSSKGIVIVALLYLVHLCGRNYVAAKHNETVNRHRANALSTYRLLVDSGETEHNRDLVLAAAAGAIFAPQETGFLKQGSDGDLTKQLLDRVSKAPSSS
jgi:hypothetical protein